MFANAKILVFSWIIVSILLFLYSFTQVDLGLTLSEMSFWHRVQTAFQHVGYFNRPLSTYLYLGLLMLLFGLYLLTLRSVRAKKINRKTLWTIIFAVTIILTFSYNAFSHDLFNYMFDARILTEYGANPYEKRALDYPTDSMLAFMHWIHRTYPYGPTWLGMTVPLAFVGGSFFLGMFYLFKIMVAATFLGSLYFIEKIASKFKNPYALLPLAAFALNPLVVIEVLVSAHNDMPMLFLSLGAVYFLLEKRYLNSFAFLFLSIGVKFATGILLPLFIFNIFKRMSIDRIILYSLFLMIIPFFLVIYRTQFQPWYLLYLLPFASFFVDKKYFIYPIIIVSIVGLFNYVPYLFVGNWDEPIPTYLLLLNTAGLSLAAVSGVVLYFSSVTHEKTRKKT